MGSQRVRPDWATELNWYFSNKGTHLNLRAVKRDSCTSPGWEYCLCFSLFFKKREAGCELFQVPSENVITHTGEALLRETVLSPVLRLHVTSRWCPPWADPISFQGPGGLETLLPCPFSREPWLMPTITAFHLSQPVSWKGECSCMSLSSSKDARVLFQATAHLVLWDVPLVNVPNDKQFVTRQEHVSLAAHHG